MDIPAFFSIAFCAACALSLFIGIYTLYLNPHSRTNVLFFVLTVALGIWAFGFSMAVSADSLAMALFWRRFSALGWGAFFSTMLHFFLVFTDGSEKGRNKWRYILLYIPAFITYLGFTYFPRLNPEQYNLVSTPLGWANIAVNNAWDWFYAAYYICYSAAGLIKLWLWGKKDDNPRRKKQAFLILCSFAVTLIFGAAVDTLGNMVLPFRIPQMAPLIMLFPAFVVCYSIKKHGLMNPNHVDEDTLLMSGQIRAKITNYMGNAFLFAALLNVIATFLLYDNPDSVQVLAFSGGLILVGVLLQIIQRFDKNTNRKDIIIAVVFSLIVPILTFRFIEFAGVTIWAFPFILLIITMVFGKSVIQMTLFISILLTQAVVWLIKPETTLKIDEVDHVARIGMFIIAIWFAWYIRKIFQVKLRENAERISAQQIISAISSDFVTVSERNLKKKLNTALSKIGAFLNLDRAYVYLSDGKKDRYQCRSIWFNGENTADTGAIGDISGESFPLLTSCIKAGRHVTVSDVSDASCETRDELPRLLGSNEKSFAAIPIIVKDEVFGFFGIDAGCKIKAWPETQLEFFKIISNIIADAFEKIQQDKEITEMAFHDFLTKLPNRILFQDRAAQAIRLAERTNKTLAVIFLDLDAFKAVNNAVGHDGGDALLIKVAAALTQCLRKSDAVSRFGGDEFLILLNNLTSTGDIQRIIEKLMAVFEKPFVIDGQEFFVTASAGIAVYPCDGADPEALIKNADLAMYKAKEQGKNRFMFCTGDMKDEILMKMKLTGSLFRALERQELRLYYQPQVSMRSKNIIGAEALLRWFHPEFGVVLPSLFIPLAEQSGLIGPIGDWVLTTACLQCRTWHLSGLPDIRVAVNVSIIQLRSPDFVCRVGQILKETQLEPKYLELEITESAAVSESSHIIDVLGSLKKLGVTISIDDFGTKYSSLSRLTAMPIDRLKLDMQFISGIGRSDKEDAIIRGIIGLAHTLNLKVIAEGVETDLQLNFLKERQCDEIQGYYFSRPVPPEELEKMLRVSE